MPSHPDNLKKAADKMPGREKYMARAASVEDAHFRCPAAIMPSFNNIADHAANAAPMFEPARANMHDQFRQRGRRAYLAVHEFDLSRRNVDTR